MNQLMKIFIKHAFVLGLFMTFNSHGQNFLVVNDGTALVVDGTTFTMKGSAAFEGFENAEAGGNSKTIIKNEGEFYTSFIYNSDSILISSGLLDMQQFYKTDNINPYIFNADTIICRQDWISQIGIHESVMGGDAVLIHDISANQSFVDDTTSTYNQITFAGNSTHVIQGTIVAHDLEFNGGLVRVSDSDMLIKYEGDIINPFNVSSFVEGKLYQYDQGSFEFPIGTATLGNRPAGIRNLTNPAWVVMEVYENDPVTNALTEGNKVDVLYDNFYVEVDFEDSYDGSANIVMSIPTADIPGFGGATSTTVVTWSDDPNNAFVNFGGTSTTIDAPYYASTSTSFATDGYYLLGSACAGFRINVAALLEGAYNAGYSSDPNYVTMLDGLYGDNAGGTAYSGNQSMYPGMFPSSVASNQPIDLVKVYLLAPTSPFTKVDSAFAWLMEDGSVMDFETATENYVSICNAAITDGSTYRIGFKARNHLPVMSNTTVTVSTAVPVSVDFTDLTNIYGAMATKSLDGFKDFIVAGEVTGDNAINAADYFGVMQQVYQLPTGVYYIQDLNLDTDVDGGDYNIIDYNSVRLYYSTFPE